MGATTLERQIAERQRDTRRAVGKAVAEARHNANLSSREVSRAAGLHHSHLPRVEAGEASLSQDALVAVATVLGCDVSLKLFPTTGVRLRDHLQVLMIEAVLEILAPRWIPRLEVPVWRPARGVIDLVLQDTIAGDLVAGEAHSLLHAVESQFRHAAEKVDGLPTAAGFPWGARAGTPRIDRLLVLRSCPANHDLVRSLPSTFHAQFPESPARAVAALKDTGARWPGPAIVWVDVNGKETRVLESTPRAVRGVVPGW